MAQTRSANVAPTKIDDALTLICPTRGCRNIQIICNTTLYNGKTWNKIRCKHCGSNYSSCKWQCQCGCTWAACSTHRSIGVAMEKAPPKPKRQDNTKQVGRKQQNGHSSKGGQKTIPGIANLMVDITDADAAHQPSSWAQPPTRRLLLR